VWKNFPPVTKFHNLCGVAKLGEVEFVAARRLGMVWATQLTNT